MLGRARWRPRRGGMVVRALGEKDEVCESATPSQPTQPDQLAGIDPSKLPMDGKDVWAPHGRSRDDRPPDPVHTAERRSAWCSRT